MNHPAEPAALPEPQQYCPTLTLRKATEEGALLVDVRERDEVAALAFDVPDIVHIPLSEFERRFAELPRERELILVCAGGQRSLKAAYYLIYQGYTRVANLQDGMTRWLSKGMPVKGRADRQAPGANGCCAPALSTGTSCCGASRSSSGCAD
jgi:rhodanese-related sulfurtransferase